MIELKKVTVSFGNETIFKDFSLEVNTGEKITLYGKSGIGKSTLLKLIVGFIPNFSGEVIVDGLPLNADNIQEIRKHTTWLPQETAFDFKTVEAMFYAPFNLAINRAKRPSLSEVLSIFEAFDLEETLLSKNTKEISGGQKQRILLASSILLKKPILLLDEPTSALDEKVKEKVTDYILNQADRTIISTTHDQYWIDRSNRSINFNQFATK